MRFDDDADRIEYPSFQIWRLLLTVPPIYSKIGEVELQDDQMFLDSDNFGTANITLTSNNTIEVQSGDVVGYYHPPETRYQVRTISSDEYRLYEFDGLPVSISAESVINLDESDRDNNRQPLIQFTIGECIFSQYHAVRSIYIHKYVTNCNIICIHIN